MATPIIFEGKQIGKLRASWLLFKESWRFLSCDKEMLLIPLITAFINLVLCGIIVAVGVIVSQASGHEIFTGNTLTGVDFVFMLALYIIAAFTLSVSQAGITNTVYTRIHGGDATLGQSLKVAFSHSASLLVWSAIAGTVGLLLRVVSERSNLIGKIVAALVGAGWNIVTFFVIPSIIIDRKTAFAAIPHSLSVFKHTWGETLVSNISLGLVFFTAHVLALLSFIGIVIMGVNLESTVLILFAILSIIVWIVLTSLAQAALQGVLKTLLYVYATERVVPQNFNAELLQAMLLRRGGAVESVPAAPVPVTEAPTSPSY